MESPNKLFFFFFFFFSLIFLTGQQGVLATVDPSYHLYNFRPTKLFVFGDSYSDTGNNRKSQASSWKFPYGITFPGKPSGRYSDGRVLTDFLATFIGVKSPVAYQWRKAVDPKQLKYGMNFAFGGTGVFDTMIQPNMTVQIDYFQQLVKESLYTPKDLKSSVALVTISGNDYAYYTAKNVTQQGFMAFITSVIKQTHINLKRIHDMGVKKIAVTGLQPIGCLPRNTADNSSHGTCNTTLNALVSFHNVLLQQVVDKLNNGTSDSPFLVLNLYDSFMAVIKNKGDELGHIKFDETLKACCAGVSSEFSCGSVNKNGQKKFTVCKKPQSAFFWDNSHPTEQGWRAVYAGLLDTLNELVC